MQRVTRSRRERILVTTVIVALLLLVMAIMVMHVVSSSDPLAGNVILYGSPACLILLLLYAFQPTLVWIPEAVRTLCAGSMGIVLFVLPLLIDQGGRLLAISQLTLGLPILALGYVWASYLVTKAAALTTDAQFAALAAQIRALEERITKTSTVDVVTLPASSKSTKLRRLLQLILE